MNKIAIVGMGCLFPGASTISDFWNSLINKTDSITDFKKAKPDKMYSSFYQPGKHSEDKAYYLKGGYINNFTFDPNGYSIRPDIVDSLDDIYKYCLYAGKEALIDSRCWDVTNNNDRFGVIIGNSSLPTASARNIFLPYYDRILQNNIQDLLHDSEVCFNTHYNFSEPSRFNMLPVSYLSAITAHSLNLSGISFTIDSACSSSIYGTKFACDLLTNGFADAMLVGGCSCWDVEWLSVSFSMLQALSTNGKSAPFDKNSTGITIGEGAGMLVLKRYEDALRDGNHIYSIISGIGLSNDGTSKGFLVPSSAGQTIAMERAYSSSEINPGDIGFVECHATGTPVGDTTELASIDCFFGRYDTSPYIGAVKSNIGHLLGASAMAGIIKVSLSIDKGVLPPTIKIENALESENGVIKSAQILKESFPWITGEKPRCAGVNSFGFGGTNGHLILEQPGFNISNVSSNKVQSQTISVVGMDAHFGTFNGLDQFERAIYTGSQSNVSLPSNRWPGIEKNEKLQNKLETENSDISGAFLSDISLDLMKYKLSPNDVDSIARQQLLMLEVASRALKDAGIEQDGVQKNIAVLVAFPGQDPSVFRTLERFEIEHLVNSLHFGKSKISDSARTKLIDICKNHIYEKYSVNQVIGFVGNIVANRISSIWNFNGPSLALSSGSSSFPVALQLAQILIQEENVDAVLIGAIDYCSTFESHLTRSKQFTLDSKIRSLGCEKSSCGVAIGEGAGAIVLKSEVKAATCKNRIYSLINSTSVSRKSSESDAAADLLLPNAADVEKAAKLAYSTAELTPDCIDYLELTAIGDERYDSSELAGLQKVYNNNSSHVALGGVGANIGYAFSASGIASFIKTSLCLHYRYFPSVPGWNEPKSGILNGSHPFYIPNSITPWMLLNGKNRRYAAISNISDDGSCSHIILSEHDSFRRPDVSRSDIVSLYFFPISANDQDSLTIKLSALREKVSTESDLCSLFTNNLRQHQTNSIEKLIVCIIGAGPADITKEIDFALKNIPKSLKTGKEWKSPKGSYFTPNPVGETGGIAFVYPGAFNSYLEMGKSLFHIFPKLFDEVQDASRFTRAEAVLFPDILFPKSITKPDTNKLEILDTALSQNKLVNILSGSAVSVLFSIILKDFLKVSPTTCFGYSLGEISMLLSQQVWTMTNNIVDKFTSSDLFKSRLSGPKYAVSENWNIPDSTNLWSSYVIFAPHEYVQKAILNIDKVYLTHINSPKETIIAGHPIACEQVISSLDCEYFKTPFDDVLHCEILKSEYSSLQNLLENPIFRIPENVNFCSNLRSTYLDFKATDISDTLVDGLCSRVDFVGIINRLYNQGIRIFVEVGPGNTCSNWIDETLVDKSHLAVPVNLRGMDDYTTIIKMTSKLIGHKVPIDLSLFLEKVSSVQAPNKRELIKTLSIDPNRMGTNLLTPENISFFKNTSESNIKQDVNFSDSENFILKVEKKSDKQLSDVNIQENKSPYQSNELSKEIPDLCTKAIQYHGTNNIPEILLNPKSTDEAFTHSSLSLKQEIEHFANHEQFKTPVPIDEYMRLSTVHETFLEIRTQSTELLTDLLKENINIYKKYLTELNDIA